MTTTIIRSAPQPTLTPENAASVIRTYGGLPVKPAESPDRGWVLGLFGPGGIGKTSTAVTITHSRHAPRALVLNAAGNPHVVASYHNTVDIIDIPAFDKVEAIRKDIVKEAVTAAPTGIPGRLNPDFPYQTIIVDNASELFYRRLVELYGPVADVSWEKHSAATADLLQLVRNFVMLATDPPWLNVIFIFQETKEKRTIQGQKDVSVSELGLNQACQGQIPGIINFLGRLYMAPTPALPYRRMLDFRPVETLHQSKWQVDRKHPIASKMDMAIYDPDLGAMLDTIRYFEPWDATRYSKEGKAPA